MPSPIAPETHAEIAALLPRWEITTSSQVVSGQTLWTANAVLRSDRKVTQSSSLCGSEREAMTVLLGSRLRRLPTRLGATPEETAAATQAWKLPGIDIDG